LLGAILLAYAPSFRVPFLLDDQMTLIDNPSIRNGPFAREAWSPPGDGNTVQGRPVLNASFAASRGISGDAPAGHRAVNVAIYCANTLLLAALLALVFRSPRWMPYTGEHARRFERRRNLLLVAAVASCALGMLAKEIVVTAPVAVFFLDRLLHPRKGRPRAFAIAEAGLAASWLPLLWVLAANDFARGGSTGTAVITRSQYLLTQFYAVPLYLARIAWPVGLMFDHGERIVTEPRMLARAALGWLAILAVFGSLLWRGHVAAAGALGLFFLVLSPTSSLVPVASQTIAEHRVYLASAIVIAGAVIGLERVTRARFDIRWLLGGCALAAAALLVLTFERNQFFQDAVRVWEDVIARAPQNWRAYSNLAGAHALRGDDAAAISALDRSLALAPSQAQSLYNRANARRRLGDLAGAEADYRSAIAVEPDYAEARNNLAMMLARRGDLSSAKRELEDLVQAKPAHASAWYNPALFRFESREYAASREAIESFLRLRNDSSKGWLLAGDVEARLGDVHAARTAYERARSAGAAGEEIHRRLEHLPGR
jgi:Flp pilus assembly protein TadD